MAPAPRLLSPCTRSSIHHDSALQVTCRNTHMALHWKTYGVALGGFQLQVVRSAAVTYRRSGSKLSMARQRVSNALDILNRLRSPTHAFSYPYTFLPQTHLPIPMPLLQASNPQGQHSGRIPAPHGRYRPAPPRPNRPTATPSTGSNQPPMPKKTPPPSTPTIPVADQAARHGPVLGSLAPGYVASPPGGVPTVREGRTAGRLPPTHMEGGQQGGCPCRGVLRPVEGWRGWRQGSEPCSAHSRWAPFDLRELSGRRRAPWRAEASTA